jgi:hypothetical protein
LCTGGGLFIFSFLELGNTFSYFCEVDTTLVPS